MHDPRHTSIPANCKRIKVELKAELRTPGAVQVLKSGLAIRLERQRVDEGRRSVGPMARDPDSARNKRTSRPATKAI